MRKNFTLIAFTLILLLMLTAASVAASSPPLAVSFEVPTVIPEEGPSFGPFTASGPAVEAGIVCPSGEVIDVFAKVSGYESQTGGMNVQVVKLFTCDDGSGEFYVKLQVRLDGRGDKFNWNIVGGTGAYEKLHGTGSGSGTGTPEGVLDTYEGQLHID